MEEYQRIASRGLPPEAGAFLSTIRAALEVMREEPEQRRPHDSADRPGGLVRLEELPTVVVPDLHARREFFLRVLALPLAGGPLLELLSRGEAQLICVGDGVHAEGRAVQRWKQAFKEFSGLYKRHAAMDEEMSESFGLMEMVMRLKREYPGAFHFLKGNHENILNEEGRGNHPFRKFAFEGEMVRDYVERFYGSEVLEAYADFERELPLLTAARNYLVSHAEPARYFAPGELIEYREHDEVVYGLTWTPNEGAEEGSVEQMLSEYCPEAEEPYYFGGHRPVSGRYALRAGGRYVQLHNPEGNAVAVLYPDRRIEPERDIVSLDELEGAENGANPV
jgi:hypothetical protein